MLRGRRRPTSIVPSFQLEDDPSLTLEDVRRQYVDTLVRHGRTWREGLRTPVRIVWHDALVSEILFSCTVSLSCLEEHVYDLTGLSPAEQRLTGQGKELKRTWDLKEYVFLADRPCVININAPKQKMRKLSANVATREDGTKKTNSDMRRTHGCQDTSGTASASTSSGTASASPSSRTSGGEASFGRSPWRLCRHYWESLRGRRSGTSSTVSPSRQTRAVMDEICDGIQRMHPRRTRVQSFSAGPVPEPSFDDVREPRLHSSWG